MSEPEITITTIPIGSFVVVLSQIKELVIRIYIRNDFTILYVRDPIL